SKTKKEKYGSAIGGCEKPKSDRRWKTILREKKKAVASLLNRCSTTSSVSIGTKKDRPIAKVKEAIRKFPTDGLDHGYKTSPTERVGNFGRFYFARLRRCVLFCLPDRGSFQSPFHVRWRGHRRVADRRDHRRLPRRPECIEALQRSALHQRYRRANRFTAWGGGT